ncbi:hypothetical protein [Actinocrispum sp. NPDC049592]|uniref:hypothetical protein n=1 Tax=Actinocrispum sp. NPDC049592 TaxID=3154835 RepID=UPI003439E9B0
MPGPWVRSAGDRRFTVVEDRRVEPGTTYAAEAVQVYLTEMTASECRLPRNYWAITQRRTIVAHRIADRRC